MGTRQADVTRPAQAALPDAPLQRPFDARPFGIRRDELRRVLRWRAACKASYASFGRTVSVRRWYFVMEWMQRVRLGHAPQSLVESLILVTLFFRLSMAGLHLMLVFPAGQVACSRSQSIWKWAASKSSPACACQHGSGRVGPSGSTP